MSPIAKKILGIYLLVLTLGVTLSTLIYLNGTSVSNTTSSLVEGDLPQLAAISKLRVAIQQQKPILYEYYANTDRENFLRKFELTQREVDAGLRTIHSSAEGKILLQQIADKNNSINQLATQLDQTLHMQPVNWDRARDLLIQVSDMEQRITPDIDALVELNRKHVHSSGKLAQSQTRLMINMVFGFSVVIFIIAVLIGYYVNTYIAETAERRRLAMFAQRNPNPVLRLTWDGVVSYANPACTEMVLQLGLTQTGQLLPEKILTQFHSHQVLGKDTVALEYVLHNHIFNCLIHAVTDLHSYHVYLEDITERKQAQEKLLHQAYHDDLTGLPNRRRFGECFLEASNQGMAVNMAVILLRVDRIKRVLESQGYEASDNLLRALVQRLTALLQDGGKLTGDIQLFRLEGATFGILLLNLQSTRQLSLLAEKLQLSMQNPLLANGQELFFTLSVGASVYPLDGRDLQSLIKNAEAAVNRVKESGGNSFQCYTQDMNAKAQRWLELENGLRRALERDEMMLHYQPQLAIHNEQIIGMEALLRWRRDDKQFVSPAEFIPLAEESGLIISIGAWVFRTACQQAKIWHDAGFATLTMAVNISARQFQHPEFVEFVAQVLKETGVDPKYVELEITESVVMHDAEKTIATLEELRALHVQLSIDDFGTGYSSLNYLKRFPIHKLKVDQSFVRNMASNTNDAAITKSVIKLGQSLNLKVIAEGVETTEQLALLKQFGCDEVQGYLFSKPVSNSDMEQLLRSARFSRSVDMKQKG